MGSAEVGDETHTKGLVVASASALVTSRGPRPRRHTARPWERTACADWLAMQRRSAPGTRSEDLRGP